MARAVHGGEQQSGDESEVIDEGAKLHLVSLPMRRAVEGQGEEEDISGSEQATSVKNAPVRNR